MYQVTQLLLDSRQPYCEHKLLYIENVERLKGGISNKCYDNALALKSTMPFSRIVSGWVIDKHDTHNNLTEILQHWWLQDMKGKSYDNTPQMHENYDYVLDMNILWYGQNNIENIKTQIAKNLMYKDNQFWVVEQVAPTLVTNPISELRTESLFFR